MAWDREITIGMKQRYNFREQCQKIKPNEAEIQPEQIHFIAVGQPLGLIERLGGAALLIKENQKGKSVAISGKNAGDQEQHAPKYNEEIDHDKETKDRADDAEGYGEVPEGGLFACDSD